VWQVLTHALSPLTPSLGARSFRSACVAPSHHTLCYLIQVRASPLCSNLLCEREVMVATTAHDLTRQHTHTVPRATPSTLPAAHCNCTRLARDAVGKKSARTAITRGRHEHARGRWAAVSVRAASSYWLDPPHARKSYSLRASLSHTHSCVISRCHQLCVFTNTRTRPLSREHRAPHLSTIRRVQLRACFFSALCADIATHAQDPTRSRQRQLHGQPPPATLSLWPWLCRWALLGGTSRSR
jgi:hypothetical protein